MSYGIAFDPKSNFQGILDSSHSGCGLIMGACRYVKQFVKIPVGGVVFMDPASAPDYFGQALNDDTLELIYVHRAVSNCDFEYAKTAGKPHRRDSPLLPLLELHGRPLPREPH